MVVTTHVMITLVTKIVTEISLLVTRMRTSKSPGGENLDDLGGQVLDYGRFDCDTFIGGAFVVMALTVIFLTVMSLVAILACDNLCTVGSKAAISLTHTTVIC